MEVPVDEGAVRQREDPLVVVPGHADRPVVDHRVMVVAEQRAVGGVGGSAVGPVDAGVVGFADGRWGGAAGPGAAFVSSDEGSALSRREQSTFSPMVDDLAFG